MVQPGPEIPFRAPFHLVLRLGFLCLRILQEFSVDISQYLASSYPSSRRDPT